MTSKTNNRFILSLLVIVLLVASALVSSQFRIDIISSSEDNSVRHLYNFGQRYTLAETIISVDRTSPQHMPGFHLGLSLWADAVGFDFGVFRVVSLYFLLLSTAMTFRLGRDLFDQRTALFAAILVALSAYNMYYAHEIRMYTLAVFETVTIFWLYWRLVLSNKQPHLIYFILLFAFSTVAIYTHSTLIFPLVGIGVYHVLFAPKNRIWLAVTITEMLAGMTFLYWLPNLIDGTQNIKNLEATNQTALEVLGSSLFLYSNGFWIGALILFAVVLWKYPPTQKSMRYVVTLLLSSVITMLALNTIVAYIPVERMRYTLVWLPSLAIIWAVGLRVIWSYSRWIVMGLLAVWLGMLVWFLPSDNLKLYANVYTQVLDERMPFHQITDVLHSKYLPFDKFYNQVVVFDARFGTDYETSLLNYYGVLIDRPIYAFPLLEDDEQIEVQFDQFADGTPGLWFVYRDVESDQLQEWMQIPRIQQALDRYNLCIEDNFTAGATMLFYLDAELSCDVLSGINRQAVVYANGYVLRNFAMMTKDDGIDVTLLWNDDITFDNSHGYSLQVFRDGEKIGQADSPVHNIMTYSRIPLDVFDTDGVEVRIILYDIETGASVGGETETGTQFERDIILE